LGGLPLLIALSIGLVGGSVQAVAATPGLAAAYAFSEGTGLQTADASGNGNSGTLSGATWTGAGKYGSGLTFDGTNDWVTVPDAASLDLTSGLTVEAWVRPTTTTGWRTVLLKEHGSTLAYALYGNATGNRPLGVVYTGGAEQKLSGPTALALNTWAHLALTYDGAQLRLYVNGTQRATKAVTGAVPSSTGALRIGGNNVWRTEWFKGDLDEVRVYSRALAAAEIQADMNSAVGLSDTQPPAPPANLRQTSSAQTTATIAWNASTDNVGVQGYQVYRGTTSLGTTTATSWTVTGLPCNSSTAVGVEAFDAAGNRSTRSTLNVSTISCDGTPPSVSITSPAGGATVSGTVPVSASATDDSGVAGVQFFVDGAAVGLEDAAPPYTVDWDTRSAGNGPRSLTAVARDTSGNLKTSQAVSVQVDNDIVAPTVALTAPADGATITGVVQLAANASDDRAVAGVRFRLDGINLGAEDTTAPYTLSWDTAGATSGSHSITAFARDAAGNTKTSTARTVFVQNGLNTGDAWKKVAVGPGYVDASTRTPVRTAGGRVYLFAADDTARGNGVGPTVIRAWKGNRAGIPTAFSEMDGANRPTAAVGSLQVLGSPDTRLDRSGVAHLVYMNESTDTLNYRTFSTVTDTWGPNEVVESSIGMDFDGNTTYRRETTNSIVLDSNDIPHIVYKSRSSLVYRNRIGGTWSAPVIVDTPPVGTPRHSSLAADALGNLHVTWLRSDWLVASNPNPQIMYRRRGADGVWAPAEVAADNDVQTNENSDQGPSIVIAQNGTPHVLYVSDLGDSFVQTTNRSGGVWIANNPPTGVFTHAPQIYGQYNDIYVFLGHDRSTNFGYLFKLQGQPWAPYARLSTGDNDGSGSPRWDPMRETNPEVIDVSFYEENLANDSRRLTELYYMAVLPSGGPTDSSPPTNPAGLAQMGATENSVSVVWNPSSDDTGVAGYGLYRNGASAGSSSVASATLSGLVCGTTYTIGVDAFDGAGNRSGITTTSAQTSPCDTIPPSVSITSPTAGASVSGTTQVSADASDNTGLVGVQFRVDGADLGVEDTSAPYRIDWNTAGFANGSHSLSAVARDLSGNVKQSAAVTVTVSNTAPPVPPGLAAAYAFAEGTGSQTSDASGHGLAGTLSGPVWNAAGKYGSALTFDGTNDWVTVADSSWLDVSGGLTLEAWVRPNGGPSWRTIMLKENGSTLAYALYAGASGGTPMGIVLTGGAQQKLSGPSALPANTWTHLALTYNGAQMRLYVNGVERATKAVTGAMPNSSGPLRIGGNNVWTSERFKGELDELRVYNRALTAGEIQADMGAPLPGQ
jgi:chitodextrinase